MSRALHVPLQIRSPPAPPCSGHAGRPAGATSIACALSESPTGRPLWEITSGRRGQLRNPSSDRVLLGHPVPGAPLRRSTALSGLSRVWGRPWRPSAMSPGGACCPRLVSLNRNDAFAKSPCTQPFSQRTEGDPAARFHWDPD